MQTLRGKNNITIYERRSPTYRWVFKQQSHAIDVAWQLKSMTEWESGNNPKSQRRNNPKT
jgi:hypothetical protein